MLLTIVPIKIFCSENLRLELNLKNKTSGEDSCVPLTVPSELFLTQLADVI